MKKDLEKVILSRPKFFDINISPIVVTWNSRFCKTEKIGLAKLPIFGKRISKTLLILIV